MGDKKISDALGSHPVMVFPDDYEVFDFSEGFNPKQVQQFIDSGKRAVGGYLEKRKNMYVAPQYQNRRNVHMGIDFWAPAEEPVYTPFPGVVAYTRNNAQMGNYGPTIVLQHVIDGVKIFALYGHLSAHSLEELQAGDTLQAGDVVGRLGNFNENGKWPPHLHYQLSILDPGEADMPGVVSEDEAEKASVIYPDPRLFIGQLYG